MSFNPGSGGGSSSIAGSTDVSLSNVQDDQVLTYDDAADKWQNKAVTGSTALFVASGDPLPPVVDGAVLHIYDPDKVLS